MPAASASTPKTISSTEQLDQLMTVTSPKGWLALIVTFLLIVAIVLWGFYGNIPLQVEGPGILLRPGGMRGIGAMASGRVLEVAVRVGDTIERGQIIARVQSVAQYPATATVEVTSPFGGTVTQVMVRTGAVVQVGDIIVNVGPLAGELDAILYLPIDNGKKVKLGQLAQITVSTVDRQQYGYMYGRVTYVAPYAATIEQMQETLGNQELVRLFTSGGAYQQAPVEIRLHLDRDLRTPSRYRWSSEHGPPFAITAGTVCTAAIETGSERPVDLVVPYLLKRFGAEPTP